MNIGSCHIESDRKAIQVSIAVYCDGSHLFKVSGKSLKNRIRFQRERAMRTSSLFLHFSPESLLAGDGCGTEHKTFRIKIRCSALSYGGPLHE